ncbi:leptin receptor-like [Brienomyrus brachyistius]|uniref:leptin receptor-like n=1 Tax=Brienomyrus brachyistius TaxID=42636 RepID=UPI0020B2C761|nr:leptin receptor-like [Brienomyrus brachyistius]
MFPVLLITSFLGMLSRSLSVGLHAGPQVLPLPVTLCCDLADRPPEGDSSRHCVSSYHSPGGLQQPTPSQSPVSILIGVQLYLNETETHGTVCFDILCWVDTSPGQLICNIKPITKPPDTPVAVVLNCLQPESNSTNGTFREETECRCVADDVVRCFSDAASVDHLISMEVTVSRGPLTAHSPIVSFLPWDHIFLQPPVDLCYKVTIEGDLLLNWTDSQSVAHPLAYDVRYFPKDSLDSWEYVDGLTMQSVSLRKLSVGVTYVIQVRCRFQHIAGPGSSWSEPLYTDSEEVTYLPEKVLASTGTNLTFYCILHNWSVNAKNAVWWLDMREKVPERQYSVINDHVSRVTLVNLEPKARQESYILHCCPQTGEHSFCRLSSAAFYIIDSDVLISCETNGDLTAMTCSWNTIQSVRFQYQVRHVPCSITEGAGNFSSVLGCPQEALGVDSCTLQPLFIIACYRMWVEFGTELNPFRSAPIEVMPFDWVKPNPPYDLVAITDTEGNLNIEWKKHELLPFELKYEMRYRMDSPDANWEVFSSYNQSVVVPVLDPCQIYIVQVRCSRHDEDGLWSDWSHQCYSHVRNSRAPSKGPDFWRVFQEVPGKNQTKVTLHFMPLEKEKPLCCVEGFLVELHNLSGQVWSNRLGLVAFYSFPWNESIRTVTVMARNDVGLSIRNTRMTLAPPTKKSKSLSQFSVMRVDSSCVTLTWTMLPVDSNPLSFVIEWRSQSTAGGVKWVRVPAHIRTFNLRDNFLSSEDYSFTLYPIFPDGEGEPIFVKEDRVHPTGQHITYLLLIIIVFLLVLALAISQHQKMKLVWRDIPDPNNCSWAKGVDFTKAKTVENLFKQREMPTSCPPLLELETISEALIVDKTKLPIEIKEMELTFDKTEEREASVSPDIEDYQELPAPKIAIMSTSAMSLTPSAIVYSSILFQDEAGLCRRLPKSFSSSSDEDKSSGSSDIPKSSFWSLWDGRLPRFLEASPFHSCPFNSQDEFSVTLDCDDEVVSGLAVGRECFRVGMDSGDREQAASVRSKERPDLNHLVSLPLLCHQESTCNLVDTPAHIVPLYVPQFRTVSIQNPRGKTPD